MLKQMNEDDCTDLWCGVTIDKMGTALAVSMLTILYGYTIKLVTVALAKD